MSKTYLPQKFINSNYRYTVSDDSILIHTNNNCYTNYNTTYCDCYYIYPKMDYLESQSYSCNYNPGSYVSYTNFSSDIWYRMDLAYILIIFLILFIFIFKYPLRIIMRFLVGG